MFFASVYCKQIQEPKPYSNETTPTMCSRDFLKTMMDNYQGDLTDILRPIGGSPPPIAAAAAPEWQFPASAITFSACPIDDFGDPFVHLGDPMIHAPPPPPPPPPPPFFHSPDDMIKASAAGEAVGFVARGKILDEDMKRPPSIFSRMLQISPTEKCESPAAADSPMLGASDHSLISPMSSKGNNCLMESSLQISSPRNTGIRRRKSQAKKVVCIPAPAPANSRPSGEIVPSDLWAWRKYGQKPIKGSPYPRGYYRCSSSKGCSARKQVERSRTDPNMLVITYTSEHNHPWPTQRNALAGSTRAQPSSKTAAAKTSPKEEACTTTENAAPPSAVKEEADREFEKMADDGEFDGQSYKPALPESAQSEESFFAGLGEIEGDSLDMLFTQGFDARVDAKGLDAFGFYDWGGGAAAAGEDERES